MQEHGRSGAGAPSSHSVSDPSPDGLGHSASVSNAVTLCQRCEAASGADPMLDIDIGHATGAWKQWPSFKNFSPSSSLDAALALLEPKHDWRRLTPKSMSVYAASPYNAAAQVRYDGYGATPPLQLCAAFFKMLAASEAKAIATEARRAETGNTGSVHEGAGPKDIAHE